VISTLGDPLDEPVHVAGGVDDLPKRSTDLVRHVCAPAAALGRFLDAGGGLLGGLGGVHRQPPDLVGDDREARAGWPRSGRFDGRVQGKDVGLERDVVDRSHDLGDLLIGVADLLHGGLHAGDLDGAGVGGVAAPAGELAGPVTGSWW
jgi:hypothetical protein